MAKTYTIVDFVGEHQFTYQLYNNLVSETINGTSSVSSILEASGPEDNILSSFTLTSYGDVTIRVSSDTNDYILFTYGDDGEGGGFCDFQVVVNNMSQQQIIQTFNGVGDWEIQYDTVGGNYILTFNETEFGTCPQSPLDITRLNEAFTSGAVTNFVFTPA